jgi:hypothetical protein
METRKNQKIKNTDSKTMLKTLLLIFIAFFYGCNNSPERTNTETLYKIGILGCNQYGFSKPSIKKYLQLNPDLMLYIGDNVYVDKADDLKFSLSIMAFLEDSLGIENPAEKSEDTLEIVLEDWLLHHPDAKKYRYFDFNNNDTIDNSGAICDNEERFVNSYFDLIFSSYNDGTKNWKFMDLKNKVPYLVTWDDHDFGLNNGQGMLPENTKVFSAGKMRNVGWNKGRHMGKNVHVKFWELQNILPGEEGIFNADIMELENGKKLQIIMLDNRWYQHYNPGTDDHTLLGREQIEWLYDELDKAADIRLIISGTHIITNDKKMESWETYDKERDEIFKAIENKNIKNIFFISGDQHLAAVSYVKAGTENLNGKPNKMFSHTDYHEFHFCGTNETDSLKTKGYFYEAAGNTNLIAWGDREDIYPDVPRDAIAGNKYSYIEIKPGKIVFKVLAIGQPHPHEQDKRVEDDKLLVNYEVKLEF